MGRYLTIKEDKEIAARYLAGESCCSIARSLGRNKASATAALHRQGVEQRSVPERNRLYQFDRLAFNVIDEQTAYWWGFLYADGCVSRRTLIVTLKKADEPHLEKFKLFMKSESPIKHYTTVAQGKSYPRVTIGITDYELASRMKELGVEKGRPHPNAVIRNISPELRLHWIRGFLDGDGCVGSDRSMSFCGGKPILKFIKKELSVLGVPDRKLNKHTKSDIYYLQYSHAASNTILSALYSNATVWLGRKRERWESWPPIKHSNLSRNKEGRYCPAPSR